MWELKLINNNSSAQQTYDYTINEGSHFIDVKFGKDAGTSSGNDTLQFKVSITPLEEIVGGSYWEYVVSNIAEDHTVILSLIESKGVWIKINGLWKKVDKIYKLINGSWIEQDYTVMDQRSKPWKLIK